MMLTEVLPETLPDAQAVKGFFDSLTWQKVIPPLVLLLVGLVAVRLLLRLFDRALERSRLERAAYAMLRSVMKVLLYFILLLLVAAQLGVDVSSLVAILSVISLALSLAVQGALTNVVGGVTLLTTRPFKAGDFVELGDQSGTVLEVSVTYTKLQTPDNKIVSIPNSTAAAAPHTKMRSRFNFFFRIPLFSTPIPHFSALHSIKEHAFPIVYQGQGSTLPSLIKKLCSASAAIGASDRESE